ncbi:MAG TPA: hypothetical protein VHI13_08340 [Candidatus Kapabacteria bacterium]|nr:hypothetical protein [Candidatus Kapabacteria bacterium]
MANDATGEVRRYLLPSGIEIALAIAARSSRDSSLLHDRLGAYLLPHYLPLPLHGEGRRLWHIDVRYVPHVVFPGNAEGAPYQAEPGTAGHASRIVPAGGGAFRMYEADAAIAAYFNPAGRSIVIEAAEGVSGDRLVQTVYAITRLLLLASLADRGGRVLHAGAVAAGDAAVAIVGEKGSGKTTLVTALLAEGAAYVASDRLFVWRDGDGIFAAGWPCTYRLDPAGLPLVFEGESLKGLLDLMDRYGDDPQYHYAGKFRFPPGDFLKAAHLKACRLPVPPRLRLAAIVELRAEDDGGYRIETSRRPEQDAVDLLARHMVRYDLPPGIGAGGGAEREPLEPAPLHVLRLHGRTNPRRMARELLALVQDGMAAASG